MANDHRISIGGSVSRNSTTTSDRGNALFVYDLEDFVLRVSDSKQAVQPDRNPPVGVLFDQSSVFLSHANTELAKLGQVVDQGCEPLPSPRSWRRPDRSIRLLWLACVDMSVS